MTAAKFIFRSLWKVKYYTLATFGLFALSRVFIYLDNYCIAALFGYVGTHPEQAFSSAALSWLAVYAALHFGSNIADGVRTFFEYRMDIRLKKKSPCQPVPANAQTFPSLFCSRNVRNRIR